MKAYKIWNDEKNFIQKDSTQLNVIWTTDINEAKCIIHKGEAFKFFFDELGFSLNPSKYDALHLLEK